MTPRIIPVPNWLLFWAIAITLGHLIFIRKAYKDDPVVLAHETIHVLQFKREGLFGYLILYLFCLPFLWNPWRARWEAEAYAVNVRAGASLQACAKIISGPSYLWPCRQSRAEALLTSFTTGQS